MHIALPIARDAFQELKGRLERNKLKYQEVDRSFYVRDPNGLGIELMPYD